MSSIESTSLSNPTAQSTDQTPDVVKPGPRVLDDKPLLETSSADSVPRNEDGSVNLAAITASGQQTTIADDKPRVRFTNIGEVRPTLSQSQTDMFFGHGENLKPFRKGWIVGMLATPDMFNEDTPQARMNSQYLSLQFHSSSLLKARWELEKRISGTELTDVDFVAIPVGQVIVMPLDVAPKYDTTGYKDLDWFFSGKRLPPNEIQSVDDEDDEEARMQLDANVEKAANAANEVIDAIEKSVELNRPVYLRKRKVRNSVSLSKWRRIIQLLDGNSTSHATVSCLHVSTIGGREFLLGENMCLRLMELLEKTKQHGTVDYANMFVRFESFDNTDHDLKAMMETYNNHLTMFCMDSHKFSKLPFELNQFENVQYHDENHRQGYEKIIGKNQVEQLTKEGEGTVVVTSVGVPLFIYKVYAGNGKAEDKRNLASEADFVNHLADETKRRTMYHEYITKITNKVAEELATAKTYASFGEYAEYRRSLYYSNPTEINNPTTTTTTTTTTDEPITSAAATTETTETTETTATLKDVENGDDIA